MLYSCITQWSLIHDTYKRIWRVLQPGHSINLHCALKHWQGGSGLGLGTYVRVHVYVDRDTCRWAVNVVLNCATPDYNIDEVLWAGEARPVGTSRVVWGDGNWRSTRSVVILKKTKGSSTKVCPVALISFFNVPCDVDVMMCDKSQLIDHHTII